MKSHLTKDFRIYFANLPERIRRLAKENYRVWRENPYHPSLAFKRIGKRYPAYSVRVGLGWRAVGFRDETQWFGFGLVPILNMKG